MNAATPTPLESLRLKLALAVGENAAFDGWTQKAVESAATQLGIDLAQARREAALEASRPEEERTATLRIDPNYRALLADREQLCSGANEEAAVHCGDTVLHGA